LTQCQPLKLKRERYVSAIPRCVGELGVRKGIDGWRKVSGRNWPKGRVRFVMTGLLM